MYYWYVFYSFDTADIEGLICPVLMELFLPERMPEEYRTEAVSVSNAMTVHCDFI